MLLLPLCDLGLVAGWIEWDLDIATNGASKNGNQLVVVSTWDWIEFVIVAPRAPNGQSKERGAESRDHVVKFIVSSRFEFLFR